MTNFKNVALFWVKFKLCTTKIKRHFICSYLFHVIIMNNLNLNLGAPVRHNVSLSRQKKRQAHNTRFCTIYLWWFILVYTFGLGIVWIYIFIYISNLQHSLLNLYLYLLASIYQNWISPYLKKKLLLASLFFYRGWQK